MHQKRTKDRRAQKTEASLREALATLIREKPYDDIVVKEILHRANVGRSTFYEHFRDKDELLCVLDETDAPDNSVRVLPVPRCRAAWDRDEAPALVVANGLDVHARHGGELAGGQDHG